MIRSGKVARFAALFLILIFSLSSIAFAQDAIAVGDTVEGTADNESVQYSINLEADEAVEISLDSVDFDAYIELLDSSGTTIASDDDSGGNLNSLLEFTAPEAGTYTIIVRSWVGDASGDFTLSVSGAGGSDGGSLGGLLGGSSSDSTSDAAQGGDLSVGDSIEGTADNNTPEFSVALSEGQSVQIDIVSEDFDTYLELLDSNGSIIDENDDGGDGLNSRLFFTAPASDTYIIRVRAFGGDATGDFTVSVSESNVVAEASGGTLSFGDSITVEPDSAQNVVFDFEASQGDVVNISVVATGDSDLEATLILTGPTGAEVANSDNVGSFFNPQLRRIELPSTGSYTLTVQGPSESPLVDSFVLSLESTELLLATDGPVTLTLSEEVQFDVVTLDVQNGQSYVVTITADAELDSTLYGDMREPGESFADTRISVSGASEMAFVYTASITGRASFELEYFTFGSDEVEITIEAAPLN
jgi:hypothetical protein